MIRADTLAFVGAALLLAITPGPDLALVTRHALRGGFRAGLATGLGTTTGLLVHATAAAAGLSTVLAASADAFRVLKLIGGLYLIVLGVQALLAARRSAPDPAAPTEEVGSGRGDWAAFRQGLLTNVLNPKVALFFLTFLPQFVRPDDPPVARTVLLGGLFGVVGLTVLTLYAAMVHRLRPWLVRARRGIEGATGTLFLAVGIRLAWSD